MSSYMQTLRSTIRPESVAVLISSAVGACAKSPASAEGSTRSHPCPRRQLAPSYSPVSWSAASWSGRYLIFRLGLCLGHRARARAGLLGYKMVQWTAIPERLQPH